MVVINIPKSQAKKLQRIRKLRQKKEAEALRSKLYLKEVGKLKKAEKIISRAKGKKRKSKAFSTAKSFFGGIQKVSSQINVPQQRSFDFGFGSPTKKRKKKR